MTLDRPKDSLESNVDDALLVAQYRLLARYLPIIYVSVIAGGMVVACMFSHKAPIEVVFPILTILVLLSIVRLSYWLRVQLLAVSLADMRKAVKSTPVLAVLYYAVTFAWLMLLLPYGSDAEQLVALTFLALMVSGAIAFNTNIVQNIIAVICAGYLPLVSYLFAQDTHESLSLALIITFSVSGQIIYARYQNREFISAIRSRFEAEKNRREAEAARRDIARIAHTDSLTGIANRRAFLQAIADSTALAEPFSIALLDLDGFKSINDLYGQKAGDGVLFTVACRMRQTIGDRGIVARIAGDEFGFLVPGAADTDAVNLLVKGLILSIARPIPLDEGIVSVSVSCGMASYPESSMQSMRLLDQADQALTSAKSSGRGVITVYNDEIENREQRRQLIESRLRTAIVQQSFDLAFQPIQHLSSGEITSYEALARWTDEHLGSISPAEFIPIAEQSGLISELSDILFEKAVKEAAQWPAPTALSFNLSPLQFHNPQIGLMILTALSKYNFPPSRLVLEITETALLQDVDRAAIVIEQLRTAGIRLALDDFGTGYAGFGYLHRMSFDKLKIDRSFISCVNTNPRQTKIVSAIVDMCHRLDMRCVAEGIETDDQLTFLKTIGCDSGQGYYLGRPGPAPSTAKPAQPAASAAVA